MSFVMQIRVANNNMKIMKTRVAFSMMRKGLSCIFLKQNLISMILYISQDDGNFFHRMLEKLKVNFIIFINCFNQIQEIAFIKERLMIVIFNTIPNFLNERTTLKNMVNIFTIMVIEITFVCNL